MQPASRGSPCRGILVFATCLALATPTSASAAEPAALPNWGAEAAAAKPALAPAPAPAAAPAAEPAGSDDVEMVDETPAASPRKARRAGGSKPAKAKKKTSKGVKAALERAAEERRPILEHAQGLENSGQLAEAAKSLSVGAEAWDDPVLHLGAADAWLKVAQTHGREGVGEDDRALVHVKAAQQLLASASADAPRVDPEEHATLNAWAEELIAKAKRHKAGMSVKKNGHGQIIAGSLLGVVGLAGIGVMSGGLYLNSVSDRELAKGEGRPDEELAPLRQQKQQGETMIAVGAVSGAIGLAIGIALVSLGVRDLKASRAEQLQARNVRVAPTIGGLVISGRF